MPPKTNKLTIYLVKPDYSTVEEILDSASSAIPVEGVGTFHFDESGVGAPDWINNFFGSTLGSDLKLLTASARGVLLVTITYDAKPVRFVVSFGHGRHLLNPGVIEDRFGLRVVLNSVDPRSLRSIDKTTLGSTPKHTREQIGKDSIAGDFGIDIEQDLVSSVTGKSRYPDTLGKTITGKDALSVSVRVSVANIKDFLSFCYRQYLSTDYQRDFAWIDQFVQRRSAKVSTGKGILSLLPSGMHQPTTRANAEEESSVAATAFREMFEELFGGKEAEGEDRHLKPLWFMRQPQLAWFLDPCRKFTLEIVSFGLNLVDGTYEFGVLLAVRDSRYWDGFGDDMEPNEEFDDAETRPFSTMDTERLSSLLTNPRCADVSLIALVEGLKRLHQLEPRRVKLPHIKLTIPSNTKRTRRK